MNQKANNNICTLCKNTFNPENFDNKKFYLITCFQFIKHIENLFDDIYKSLNQNGALFIVCHSYNSFVNKILGIKIPIYDIEHLQIFSKKSVKKIFELSGFKNIEVFSISNNYTLSYWVKLFPFPGKIKKALLKFLNTTLIGNIKIPINVGNIGCIGYKI
ncbi:class I SAM-dependent methyltransferase [Brachyspira pilosicoli]|uniref:methyltransferase domain-containing protein n=1 Tax=Brachyspira pilosicoli TaxID=52584 RepID=UPI0025436D99|nr:methyltransferase domain-containing protein [Brachyspira pilosicoli]WIH82893.1 class I SAM-dependent methyltransferase [Brachyspira pilosicoli]